MWTLARSQEKFARIEIGRDHAGAFGDEIFRNRAADAAALLFPVDWPIEAMACVTPVLGVPLRVDFRGHRGWRHRQGSWRPLPVDMRALS